MVDLLKTLITPLAEHPEEIKIEPVRARGGIVLEVRVHPDDMGRVIGRGGRRANAMRSVMKAKGNVTGERIMIDILD